MPLEVASLYVAGEDLVKLIQGLWVFEFTKALEVLKDLPCKSLQDSGSILITLVRPTAPLRGHLADEIPTSLSKASSPLPGALHGNLLSSLAPPPAPLWMTCQLRFLQTSPPTLPRAFTYQGHQYNCTSDTSQPEPLWDSWKWNPSGHRGFSLPCWKIFTKQE